MKYLVVLLLLLPIVLSGCNSATGGSSMTVDKRPLTSETASGVTQPAHYRAVNPKDTEGGSTVTLSLSRAIMQGDVEKMKSLSANPTEVADWMEKRRNSALITIGEPSVEIGSMNYVGEDLTCTALWQLVKGWLRLEYRLTRTEQGEWVAASNPVMTTLPFNPKALVDRYWIPGLGSRASSQVIHTLAVEEFHDDFLVLALFSGEGPQLRLFRIGMPTEGKWRITHVADGRYAISKGFSVNQISDGSETILFGDLRSSTWIPATDQRKATAYRKMTVKLEDLTTLTNDLGQANGYIVVVDSVSSVKEVNLFNGQGDLVSSLNDLVAYGDAISDVRWRVSPEVTVD